MCGGQRRPVKLLSDTLSVLLPRRYERVQRQAEISTCRPTAVAEIGTGKPTAVHDQTLHHWRTRTPNGDREVHAGCRAP